jgi:MFS family permease
MLAGRLADIIGFYRQMILGATLVALSALPAFILINVSVVTTLDIYLFIALLTIAGTIINGCAMPFLASCFPASCRYCGVALSSTLGSALLAGTTPLMNTLLITWFGTKLAPAFWLIFNSLLTASFIWYYKYKTQGNTSCPV